MTYYYYNSIVKIVLLLLSCRIQQLSSQGIDYNNPQVLATLQHFDVQTESSDIKSQFTCTDLGARCVFREESFSTVSYGSGQNTVNEQGATWAWTNDDAVLTLGTCTSPIHCIVTCNANCTCSETDGTSTPTPCEQVTSRAPTPAPRTEPPTLDQCPKRLFTQFCPDLMQNALPDGVDDEYECYNFCGGAWVSTCDLQNNCGTLDCNNKTAVGTKNGQVQGCTQADLTKPITKSDGNGDSAAATTTTINNSNILLLISSVSVLIIMSLL